MQVRSVYVSLQRRGAVKRWTGRLPSESPRRERERRDGRERERCGVDGPGARRGGWALLQGWAWLRTHMARRLSHLVQPEPIAARARLLPCLPDRHPTLTGALVRLLLHVLRAQGTEETQEREREVCFCCPSLHTDQCNAIVLPLVLSLSLCPLSTTAPTSRLCAGCSTDTYRIWEAASLEPGMCARTTRMTNVTTPRCTGAHCLQTVPTFEAWTDQSK